MNWKIFASIYANTEAAVRKQQNNCSANSRKFLGKQPQ